MFINGKQSRGKSWKQEKGKEGLKGGTSKEGRKGWELHKLPGKLRCAQHQRCLELQLVSDLQVVSSCLGPGTVPVVPIHNTNLVM